MFERVSGLKALKHGSLRQARQGCYVTAKGRAVPWQTINGINVWKIPQHSMRLHFVERSANETDKGRAAVEIVKDMIYGRHGGNLVPIRSAGTSLDIAGTDLVVNGEDTIQVKCDYRGGHKELGGTGNLFLQTAECNPFQKR